VPCPYPHEGTRCSGNQCCPDGSTCPSAFDEPAKGCNLKKYDCTTSPPINRTCGEGDVVTCPGSDTTCAGDMLCPDGSTCPSASVYKLDERKLNLEQNMDDGAEAVFEKRVDCNAYFKPGGVQCAVGEHVPCPGHTAMCQTDQCCPDGSTCPSAPSAHAAGCPKAKNYSCELFGWDVSVRVSGVVFDSVDEDTKAELMARVQSTYAWNTRMAVQNIQTSVKAGSIIVNAKLPGNPGWSQDKTDRAITSGVLSEGTQVEVVEIVEGIPSIDLAASGTIAVGAISAAREDQPTPTPTRELTPAPPTPARTPVPTARPTTVVEQVELSGTTSRSVIGALAVVVYVATHLSLF